MNDYFVWGYFAGILCTVILLLSASHLDESMCQLEHNIADCTWVLVPTTVQP
jgi:hypothetical protein